MNECPATCPHRVRLEADLARAVGKHGRYAAVTNEIITDLTRENLALRAALDAATKEPTR